MAFLRVVVLIVLAAAPLAAQKQPFTVEKLLELQRISDPQVSPDGRTVTFTVVSPSLAENASPRQIWAVRIMGLADAPRQLTREGTRNQRARWSPDGQRIALISNRGGSQQVWVMDADGGNARQVTDVPGEADGVLWSPDGRRLLFHVQVFPDCKDLACNRQRAEQQAKSPVQAKVFEELLYRRWNSYRDNRYNHLFIVPVEGGTPIDLTPGKQDVPPFSLGGPDEYAFSPDGKEVAYTANIDEMEAVSTNKDLFLAPAEGGQAKRITDNPAWDGTPVYSPDGRYIAYRAMTRPGYEADRFQLLLYDRKTGQRRALTEKYDRSVDAIVWSPDSRRIYFGAQHEGTRPIVAINAAGGEPKLVVTGESNDEFVLTPDGRTLVLSRSSLAHPAEIYRAPARGTTAQPQPITRINQPLLVGVELSGPERFILNPAGRAVHGWLIKPPNFDPRRKYPAMFLLHGGPQTAWNNGWSYRWNAQVFAGAGYVIVMVNRTGSTGFGQEFTDLIRSDWGGRPLEDIMAGVKYVEALPYVDAGRVGASGASYGGYLANWIAGRTGRFRCLVSHAGLFDLSSFYGTTEELWFPEWEFEGTPGTNPEVYRRLSPGSHVENFKTPTLVIHGQLDYRVDVSQGFQMFTALQKMKVPSKMIYFPDEGHWILKPANSAFWYKQVIEWWDRWLKPENSDK